MEPCSHYDPPPLPWSVSNREWWKLWSRVDYCTRCGRRDECRVCFMRRLGELPGGFVVGSSDEEGPARTLRKWA